MSSRSKAREERYVAAAPEVRDHEGVVVLSKKDAMSARRARIDRALSFRHADQTGIGYR